MANPQNLNKGGTPGNKGGGRKKLSVLKEKEDWLNQLLQADFDPQNAHPLVARLRHLAEKSQSSATLEYIFNQRFGAPKSTVVNVVENETVIKAGVSVINRYIKDGLLTKDLGEQFLKDWQGELQ